MPLAAGLASGRLVVTPPRTRPAARARDTAGRILSLANRR